MRVFISYDFDDKEKFGELVEVFGLRGIEFFDPRSMLGTRPLAAQLRESINGCTACVFIATHNSVNSSWCAAELGAFWGAGKDVILYVADTSLKDDQLPRQFTGWLLVRNLFKVADDLKALGDAEKESDPSIPLLSTLTVEDFKALIGEVIQGAQRSSELSDLIFKLGGDFDRDYDEERFKRLAGRGLRNLLGETLPKALEIKMQGWRYAFDALTTTGTWVGYGQVSEQHADGMLQLYKNCLLLRLDDQRRIVGAALARSVAFAHRALGLNSWTNNENVLAHAGSVELGIAIPEE